MGDLIVVIYFLLVPSISIIMGGFASGNPLASLGASREIKLILSYELPFILAVLVAVIHADFSLRLGDILATQAQNGVIAVSWSGGLALLITLICMQGKLALVPFDTPEAETEIAHGVLIEYSGTLLAVYRLMKNMLFFASAVFYHHHLPGGLESPWSPPFVWRVGICGNRGVDHGHPQYQSPVEDRSGSQVFLGADDPPRDYRCPVSPGELLNGNSG